MASNPRFPIYIPSKSRAKTALTPRVLDGMGVPYRLVIEAGQFADYAEFHAPEKLLVLDESYVDAYETCDPMGDQKGVPKGSGPARNFIWDHAVGEGHERHWIIDDNIQAFGRLHQNRRLMVGDGMIFHAMEEFALRYLNVALAGPNYWSFVPSRAKVPPLVLNTRLFSCILIRNDLRFRWRCRYNEDLDLSLRILKAGWATVQFNAFLAWKIRTQHMAGGNTEAFYASEGTLPKSKLIVRLHPDVARLAWKWGRAHHYVDYRPFKDTKLVRRPDYESDTAYRFRLDELGEHEARTPYLR